MKLLKKTLKILVLVIPICLIFLLNCDSSDAAESQYEKGDIRCPLNKENNNVKCTGITKNGKTVEVDITYDIPVKNNDGSDGNIHLTKMVTRTDTRGYYNVQFKVSGENVHQTRTVKGQVNVFILFDNSDSMVNLNGAKASIEKFSKNLKNAGPNYNVGLIQFATKMSVSRTLQNKKIPAKGITGSFGMSSHLENALKEAYSRLKKKKNNDPTATNYIVVFGDGRYYLDYPSSTCNGEGNGNSENNCTSRWRETEGKKTIHGNNSIVHHLNQLNNLGVKIFGVHYNGKNDGNYSGNVHERNAYVNDCAKLTYRKCDLVYMGKVATSGFADAADKSTFDDEFQEILNSIKEDVYESSAAITGNLTDKIGDEFYLTDDTGRYQRFDVPSIDENGWTSPIFEIEIDPLADPDAAIDKGLEKYWHKANENFTLSYTSDDGEVKSFTVKDNPEVYWIPDSTTIPSCSAQAGVTTIRAGDDSDEYGIWSKVCYEGYDNKDGYKVTINVNNQKEGVTKFNLLPGLGFPSTIHIDENMVCHYKFDVAKYNEQYNEIENSLNSVEEGSKEWYSLYRELQNLDNLVISYQEVSSGRDLEDYKTRFIEQSALLKVRYNNINDVDEENFVNKGEVNTTIKTEVKGTTVINGREIDTDKTYYTAFSKDMELQKSCLNMQTGEQEECSESKAQLDGNNKIYVKLKATGGTVFVDLLNAGYRENLDFYLRPEAGAGKDGCEFETTEFEIKYRQIQLEDPFLKTYNSKRGVGENYLGNKFDFEKIIHGDTWSSENAPEYDYFMSKTNISNIRRDTKEEKNSAYLGRNCYFTSNSKYQCDFTRNRTENNASNGELWFSRVDGLKLE